ncbi:TonB-dependent receptor [Bacteroides sp. UBA939]|uniref:TonB-dependent receptor n=1 Tax=Bacteroides sp. UBA939 TaxID=1946092 RepID=UPI0025B96A5C|nr:TonB-dependent receptor [Bacteroides sp. UBA939]
MRKIIYTCGAVVLTVLYPIGTQAQRQVNDSVLNRTVVVEQEYNPNIMDASKINVLPKVEPPTVSKKTVEYDTTLMPAGDMPASTMQAYTGIENQPEARHGYARLGYGIGNLDLRANYLFNLSKNDKLSLNFLMDGMNAKVKSPQFDFKMPEEADSPEIKIDMPEKWKSYQYHTRAGLDYVHAFKNTDLNVAGNFDLRNFNMAPSSINSRQKFTSGDMRIGIKSTTDALPLQFHAEANFSLFQRRFYYNHYDATEYTIGIKAGAIGKISEEQYVGLELAMDNLSYSKPSLKSNTFVELNPYYLFENEEWKIRLGAHIDLASGLDNKLHVAPDITLQYTFSDSYILYAQATGKRHINDFRRMATINPHSDCDHYNERPNATYERINAALGFKMSPVDGLWFNMYGGYQELKNDLAPILLLYQHYVLEGNENPQVIDPNNYRHFYRICMENINTSNMYAGAEIRYDYKNTIAFTAKGIYRNWKASEKEKNSVLWFKPAFEADFNIDIRPVSSVTINLGYQHLRREKTEGINVNTISNLNIGGSYELFDNISIYARINNLLNKNNQYYPYYSAQGINFLGGMSFRF